MEQIEENRMIPSATLDCSPIEYGMDAITNFNSRAWKKLKKSKERYYRVAQAGRDSWLRIPSWWGGSPRPPEGSRYLISIEYKDLDPADVDIESHSGLTSPSGRSQVHGFTTTGHRGWQWESFWLSWDLLLLVKEMPLAELSFQTTVDLTIARLRIEQVRDQAGRRQFAHAWAKRRANTGRRVQQPLPSSIPGRSAIVHFNGQAVGTGSQSRNAEIRLVLSQNETRHAEVLVYSEYALGEVEIRLEPPRNSSGQPLETEVCWYAPEGCLHTGHTELGWAEQALWKHVPLSIQPNGHGLFVITVTTNPDSSRPGIYAGVLRVACGGSQSRAIPFTIEVLPIRLVSMSDAGLLMGCYVNQLPALDELRRMRRMNHNAVGIWFHRAAPEIRNGPDGLEFDFYILDHWMREAKAHGIETVVWFLGGNPDDYPNSLWLENELYAQTIGSKEEFRNLMKDGTNLGCPLSDIRAGYASFIRRVGCLRKERGWPDIAFTPFDEPAKWASCSGRGDGKSSQVLGSGPWIKTHFKELCELIRCASTECSIYMSMHRNFFNEATGEPVGETFVKDVDIVCTNIWSEDPSLPERLRQSGKRFWQYGNARGGRYAFGFLFESCGSTGAMAWAYNWYADALKRSHNGWAYAWHTPFGTLPSLLYHAICEGIDDRRYMATLRCIAKDRRADISPFFERLFRQVQDQRHEKVGENGCVEFIEPLNRAILEHWRCMVADEILRLSC